MRAASEPEHERARELLHGWLLRHPGIFTVAIYAPLAGEVDLLPLVTDKRLCWVLPVVAGDDLEFRVVEDLARDLVPGAFGISEPRGTQEVVPVAEIDAFVCPGLGFDMAGGRIGRGKGYYDRALARARDGALRVAVVMPWQMVADTHAEPHDIRMDVLLEIGE
jgi:5-formyltetrahydrofolate cyclo-ligase